MEGAGEPDGAALPDESLVASPCQASDSQASPSRLANPAWKAEFRQRLWALREELKEPLAPLQPLPAAKAGWNVVQWSAQLRTKNRAKRFDCRRPGCSATFATGRLRLAHEAAEREAGQAWDWAKEKRTFVLDGRQYSGTFYALDECEEAKRTCAECGFKTCRARELKSHVGTKHHGHRFRCRRPGCLKDFGCHRTRSDHEASTKHEGLEEEEELDVVPGEWAGAKGGLRKWRTEERDMVVDGVHLRGLFHRMDEGRLAQRTCAVCGSVLARGKVRVHLAVQHLGHRFRCGRPGCPKEFGCYSARNFHQKWEHYADDRRQAAPPGDGEEGEEEALVEEVGPDGDSEEGGEEPVDEVAYVAEGEAGGEMGPGGEGGGESEELEPGELVEEPAKEQSPPPADPGPSSHAKPLVY